MADKVYPIATHGRLATMLGIAPDNTLLSAPMPAIPADTSEKYKELLEKISKQDEKIKGQDERLAEIDKKLETIPPELSAKFKNLQFTVSRLTGKSLWSSSQSIFVKINNNESFLFWRYNSNGWGWNINNNTDSYWDICSSGGIHSISPRKTNQWFASSAQNNIIISNNGILIQAPYAGESILINAFGVEEVRYV